MSGETPLLKQYRTIKSDYPEAILMFRIGDFYEMLERDAELAARELELTLTSKPMGKAGRVPLAGMPHHAVEPYIAKLVRRGYHVAVCDQTEDPSKAKGLVRREVTRLVTPGTYESQDGRRNNFFAAIQKEGEGWGAVFCDLQTGEFYAAAGPELKNLANLLARFSPTELIIADADQAELTAFIQAHLPDAYITETPSWQFAQSYADEELKRHFGVSSLQAFGFSGERGEVNASGQAGAAALAYLKDTQKSEPNHITAVRRIDLDQVASLDPSTLLHLEITDSPTNDREATLVNLLDDAVTAMGSRLIRRRLTAPLKESVEIRERLDRVQAFVDDIIFREEVREMLKSVHDLERLASRLSLGSILPREVSNLALSLEKIAGLRERLDSPVFEVWRDRLDDIPEAVAVIRERLTDDPPAEIGASPLFREGVSETLDELRSSSRSSREWIAKLQAIEREKTGISSLKVGFNNVFGYYIEVTKTHISRVPDHYMRKQTLSSAERYITEELKQHEDVVLTANEKIIDEESRLFQELRGELLSFIDRLQSSAAAVAEIDLSASFATVAQARGFVRPEILDQQEPYCRIEGGRHPMVESLLKGESSFVPNDTFLKDDERFMLLTGPNMAGKSTYIRQVAVIALMAQIGSYVPARNCALTPFDALFTRIGASDRLARGLSTFMVEMVEAATILRSSTSRSLVILDEIGRGTSTYDGLSIAWSMVEALSARGCLSLFATHYHELTRLATTVPGVFNATVAVREWNDGIHFLHEIRPGAADRSYGIQVASLAGVPRPVIERAKEILGRLEAGDDAADEKPGEGPSQMSLWERQGDPVHQEIVAALSELDPDDLTPRQAHELIAELRSKLK